MMMLPVKCTLYVSLCVYVNMCVRGRYGSMRVVNLSVLLPVPCPKWINFRHWFFCFGSDTIGFALWLALAEMSLFFFRLHNLRREEEKKNRRRKFRSGGCGGGGGGGGSETPSIAGGRYDNVGSSSLTINTGKLFEKPFLAPADSLDEEALKIPRLIAFTVLYHREFIILPKFLFNLKSILLSTTIHSFYFLIFKIPLNFKAQLNRDHAFPKFELFFFAANMFWKNHSSE